MSLKLIISDRRLWPLFWTQFFGALGDNVFKNVLVMLITYRGVSVRGLAAGPTVALAGGLFVLPFFLFSPYAGAWADKLDKSRLVRLTKIGEIGIMACASVGFYLHAFESLLLILFLAGVQAAIFGPVKYSLLPESVHQDELVTANAYVEMGTFIAILLGTVLGGLLAKFPAGEALIPPLLLSLSLAGLACAWFVRPHPAASPQLVLRLNPWASFGSLFKTLSRKNGLWSATLGASWFWFIGAALLSVLPLYGKSYLNVDEGVVTAFLALFTIGIGAGGLVAQKLSFGRTELGLVPTGSLGLTVFLLDLARRAPDWDSSRVIGTMRFFATHAGPWIAVDFFAASLSAGLFILPLFTLLQERSEVGERSRVIAANNVINALFMVCASALVGGWTALNWQTPRLLAFLAVLNLGAGFWLAFNLREILLRYAGWVLTRLYYGARLVGEPNLPRTGGVLLVCHHVSPFDWLIIGNLVRRPVRFVRYINGAESAFVSQLARIAKVIPIAGKSEHAEILAEAIEQIVSEIKGGGAVALFPRGPLVERIQLRVDVPVIPLAFKSWGNFRAVTLNIGTALKGKQSEFEELERVMKRLGGEDAV